MDLINVFVIIGRGWKKSDIVNELQCEGYKHNFCFGEELEYAERLKVLDFADEVWQFGDCVGYETYDYAVANGYDIWRMG